MCGKNSKPALLFSVLLFSVFSLLFSGGRASGETSYILTEAEMKQLEMIFNQLGMQNKELQENLTKLQGGFATVIQQSEILKEELKEVRSSLTKAEVSLTKYAEDVTAARRMAVIKTVLYTVGGFLTGGVIGYAVGAF